MSFQRRIAENTLSLFLSGVLAQFLGFCAIVYAARILGPEGFGKMTFATAVIIYFTMATNIGLPLLGTREIARDHSLIHDYVGNILIMRLFLAMLCFLAILFLSMAISAPVEVRYLIALYGLSLFPSALMLDWAFQGLEKMKYMGLGRVMSVGIYTISLNFFVKGPDQLLYIPCLQAVSSLITASCLIFLFNIVARRPTLEVSLGSWKSLLARALPFGASIVMVQVFYYVDSVMLGVITNYDSVGYYNAATKIVFLCTIAGGAYFDAVYPVASQLYQESKASLLQLQRRTVKMAVAFAVPLAVGGVILARQLMELIYGPTYSHGTVAFQILIWFGAANYVNMAYSRALWACDKQNTFLKIVTIQALVNIFLNLIFIPLFGMIGAAISTTAVEIIGLALGYIAFSRILSVPLSPYCLKPVLASLAMASYLCIGLFRLDLAFPALLCGGIVFYFIALYLLGGIDRQELDVLKGFFLASPTRYSED